MSDYLKVISEQEAADTHCLFRGRFELAAEGWLTIRSCGAAWYELTIDGGFLDEGPARFRKGHPEWTEARVWLRPGRHVLAAHVHDQRVTTRLLSEDVEGFLWVEATSGTRAVGIEWRTRVHPGYRKTGRRLGCVLGWAEWCDTRRMDPDWRLPEFDDTCWLEAPRARGFCPAPVSAQLGPMRYCRHDPVGVGEGELVTMSMHDHDPPMSFVCRELECNDLPPNGRWWRFDLGRVMLGRPELKLSAPAGTIVQVAYAESLNNGRVYPYLKSGGGTDSCMLDTWIARGGEQIFYPLQPKGGRFLELHALADPEQVELREFVFTERVYFDENIAGSFRCNDELLNRIWTTGVETLRSCSEDAITDNPARERGQWLGDAVGPGMDILSVTCADWRPLVRGLRQAAECARPDGLTPAVFPGTLEYLPSFSVQWVSAIPHYHELSGNIQLLRELYPAAVRNLEVFEPFRVVGGLRRNPEWWNFVDWGYAGSASVFMDTPSRDERMDPALSLFYLRALRALAEWAGRLEKSADADGYRRRAEQLEAEMRAGIFQKFDECWGYHAAALALAEGLLEGESRAACLRFIKAHIENCFPNDPTAPRLSDTRVEATRLITPFFMHFVLPVLAEHGEMDFVQQQIRQCWGWMLEQGVTTWYEVFDPRWSHCHQWSGCPTWILSRYGLGIHARFDLGEGVYRFGFEPGSLKWAQGHLPVQDGTACPQGGETLGVKWKRQGGYYEFEIECPHPFTLMTEEENHSFAAGAHGFSCVRQGLGWKIERHCPVETGTEVIS
ncbi:family 78 glycoside hydrolase catalytic domain [Ruficoccus amylovorans]|uniref:Family 78 glycoside hydrolase catalytic domain n=1 Tax=Ruficoccus amylovorans TaxID=1804625 RepID=A0A842HBS6_9BACT|nr:family 78 glycoside hydrolase catalytic domain [Ruficoccus amylovorans]MBC2593895.1 family 78 glycoside hydrolase catalytic domain [Ruficoccus amylovorans]